MDNPQEDTIEQLRDAAIRGRGTEEAPEIVCARYGRRGKRAQNTIARYLRLMGWARFVDVLKEAFDEESRCPSPRLPGENWRRLVAFLREECLH